MISGYFSKQRQLRQIIKLESIHYQVINTNTYQCIITVLPENPAITVSFNVNPNSTQLEIYRSTIRYLIILANNNQT